MSMIIRATVIFVLLVMIDVSYGSFPLSKLSKFKGDFYTSGAHAVSNNTLLMTMDGTYSPDELGLNPQVLVPPKPWAYETKLALRLNYKKNRVAWARAFVDLEFSTRSCTDHRGNLYVLAQGFGPKSVIALKKIASNGKVVWERSFKYHYGATLYIDVMNIECASNSALIILARKESRTHFVIINPSNGKLKTIVPASQENKPFEHELVDSSSADDLTCIFSYVFRDLGLEDMYIHCIHTKGVLKVSTRMLDTLKYPARTNLQARLVVAPDDGTSECPAVYVLYLYVPPTTLDTDPESSIIKIRKLCVETLQDMSWSPGEEPQTRYIRLQENGLELYPFSLIYLPTTRSVTAIFSANQFESFGKVDVSQNFVTLLGSKAKAYEQPELWLFCYGQSNEPAVVPIPVRNNKAKGYMLEKPYDRFYIQGFELSKSGTTIVAYGVLYNNKEYSYGPLSTFEIKIPSKSF